MRNLFSMAVGGILLFVALGFSACASADGGGASKPTSPSNDGVTIGPATVAPGTNEFESPWPFGPLGMD
jgi:hypothetical protein